MHIIAFATNEESLDNYFGALQLVQERGGKLGLIYIQRDAAPLPSQLALIEPALRHVIEAGTAMESAARDAILRTVALAVVREDPDIFFLCDSTEEPLGKLWQYLRDQSYRGLVIGGQGSLGQAASEEFGAARFLGFGLRQINRLSSGRRCSAYPVGLPRLDRLKGLRAMRAGYGVFLAGKAPEPTLVNAALAAFEKNVRVPIVVYDHPSAPGFYSHRPAIALPPLIAGNQSIPIEQVLQNCNFVLATDSSRILDALYLGKPTVLLPSRSLTAFDHYPGIADGFGPAAIADAFRRLGQNQQAVSNYLREAIGGVRYDHSESVFTALVRLAVSGPLRPLKVPLSAAPVVAYADDCSSAIETRVELLKFVPPGGNVAELGVAKGSFSDEMLRARGDIHLYSIDRWAGDRGHDDVEFEHASNLLRQFGSRSTILRKDFESALLSVEPASLDLAYIDGYAHNGQDGVATLNAWWAKIKPGGILAGHDYHADWPATVGVVNSFCAQHRLVVHLTTGDYFQSWYVWKPVSA